MSEKKMGEKKMGEKEMMVKKRWEEYMEKYGEKDNLSMSIGKWLKKKEDEDNKIISGAYETYRCNRKAGKIISTMDEMVEVNTTVGGKMLVKKYMTKKEKLYYREKKHCAIGARMFESGKLVLID